MKVHCSRARSSQAPLLLVVLLMALTSGMDCASAKAPFGLNDTGQGSCAGWRGPVDCLGTGQDGEFGRDVEFPNQTNGKLGFSFVKISDSGASLPANATAWACVKDRVTGLLWEVKTRDGGLRDMNNLYTNWGDGRPGDASALTSAVNAIGLCGHSDWRLPTRMELQGLINYGNQNNHGGWPDYDFFPNTLLYWDWTASNYAGKASFAWSVSFGAVRYFGREQRFAVRLVRAEQ